MTGYKKSMRMKGDQYSNRCDSSTRTDPYQKNDNKKLTQKNTYLKAPKIIARPINTTCFKESMCMNRYQKEPQKNTPQSAKDDSMTHQHDMSGARTSSLTALDKNSQKSARY